MIRIGGLVRAFNQVRATLQAGIPRGEEENFRRQIRQIIREVEEICAGQGSPSRILPGPSRMAYQFLKNLDLDNLPVREADQLSTTSELVKIRNVVGIAESLARQVWLNRQEMLESPAKLTEMITLIRRHTGTIEGICHEHGQTAAALETRTRVAYTYLSFASSESNLRAILVALQKADEAAQGFRLPPARPLVIDLLGMNSLWRFRQYSNALVLRVNPGFISAEVEVWRALLASILGVGTPLDRQVVTEFTLTEEFNNLLFEIEALAAPPTPVTRGRVHDLEASFKRVNDLYFSGRMDRPILCWNQTLTSRKFGHYQPSRDTVMISVSLDSPEVSTSLLDYVVYHELLHKKHGSQIVNGRRIAHSAAFRADERLYTKWEEAERELTRLATRQATGR
jgi:hypothetical protein